VDFGYRPKLEYERFVLYKDFLPENIFVPFSVFRG